MPQPSTYGAGNSAMDTNEKIVDLVNSPEVKVMVEGKRDFIDMDIDHMDKGKYYRVEYEGDVYGVEKQPNNKITLYEVID